MKTNARMNSVDIARTVVSEESADVAELFALLREQDAIAQRLVAVMSSEREALVAGDTGFLDRMTIEKNDLGERMADTEQRRLAWVASWAKTDHPETITLSDIIDRLPKRDADSLRSLRETLSRHVGEATEANKRNGMLLFSLMGVLRGFIEQMLGLQGLFNHTYGASGTPGGIPLKPSRVLDTRI